MAQRNTNSPKETVASDYGPLALCNVNQNRHLELPSLQFETGDLIIKFSNHREEWLLVHSEVVAASSPMLAASLSGAWAQYAQLDTIKHPKTGEKRLVRSLALKQVDGTFFLEGKDVDLGEEEDSVVFQHSAWSSPGWPDLEHTGSVLNMTTQALCILFALFYGAELSAEQIVGKKEVSRAGIYYLNGEAVDLVCTVCAYAEYFECGNKIKQQIVRAMQSAPGYWIAVADSPKRHIMMAVRLKLRELYWDALRHLVAQVWQFPSTPFDWSDVAEAMERSEDKVRSFFEPQMQDMPNLIARLNADLMKLSLEPVQAYQAREAYTAYTSFMKAISFRKAGRSQATKANEAAGFIARNLWTQFYIGSFYGEELETNHRQKIVPKKNPSQPLNRIINTIERANTAHDPTHIFGTMTPAHLASLFNLGPSFDTSKAIKHHLREIFAEANRIIVNAFPLEVEIDASWGRCLYGRANFDANNAGYFTYMKVPAEVPWVERTARLVDGDVAVRLPRVDMRDASKEWIEAVAVALGAEVESEEDVAEDSLASMSSGTGW